MTELISDKAYDLLRHTCKQFKTGTGVTCFVPDPDCEKCVQRQLRIERAKAHPRQFVRPSRRRYPSLDDLDRGRRF
jgi:hypothetical protein